MIRLIVERGTVLCIVLALTLLTIGCEDKKPAVAALAALPVIAVKAVARDMPEYREYPGTTQSPAAVQVDARVKGYLQERLFEEGQEVEKDQLLYRIQPEPYAAQVSQAEADVQIARTNLEFAKTEYDRNEPLSKTGAISKQEWDKYARGYADAQGKLAVAEGNMVEARLNLSYTQVIAPIAGRIGATFVDVGNLVGPGTASGQTLAQLVQLDPMRVVFQPAADEFPAFAAAQAGGAIPVQVTIAQRDAEALTFEGTIDLLNNTAQSGTSTFMARAQFPNAGSRVLPGQYASVRVTLRTIVGAVLVPSHALFAMPARHFVYVVKSDDTVERRDVEIGDEFGGFTRITAGLKADEVVVVSASPLIGKGVAKVDATIIDADAYLTGDTGNSKTPAPAPGGRTSGTNTPGTSTP